MEIVIGIAVFALQLGGYAVWRSYKASADRIAQQRFHRETRRIGGAGRFIGGSNRPGEN